MANWTKRTSKKTGRYTRSTTTTTGGQVTNTRSTRVGNGPRMTTSYGPGGPKDYMTEYSSLGQRKTRWYPTGRPYKAKKVRYRKGSLKTAMWLMLAIAAFYTFGYFFA